MVNFPEMTTIITIRMTPMHRIPIMMPFIISDSFNFLLNVNSPESQYSCAKGKTSQHIKKLMQQTTFQASCTFSRQRLFSSDDQYMSMGRIAKQRKEQRMLRKTSSLEYVGALLSAQQTRMRLDIAMVNANSHQQITYITIYFIQSAHLHIYNPLNPKILTHQSRNGFLYIYFQIPNNLQVSKTMDLGEQVRPKKIYNVIQPNTTRVLEMRRQKMQKQLQKRTLEQKQRKLKQDQQRKNASLMRMREDEKRLELKRREEEQRRKREQESQSNTLSGRFGHMINDLNTNTTNHQFTISGMDLRPAQIKVLISNVQNNSSLKGLTMCRKGLTDIEGCQVAQKLLNNSFLQRLELEGNSLGSQTLVQISKLLATNESLRVVDLEGNKLIKGENDKPNYKGIQKLVEALKSNDTLLSLNLNGTGLDSFCSGLLLEMTEHNSTLILLDIDNNPDMNIEDVTAIQDALLKNKQDYDDERYMEFIERKRMRREEDISGVLLLNQQTKKLRSEAIDLNIKTKKAQLDEEWTQFLASEQLKKQKEIVRMEKEAASKKTKKKKK